MDRRQFSAGLIGAGLGSPLLSTPAFASQERDNDSGLPPFGRVQLQIATGVVLLSWFLLLTNAGLFGMDLKRPVRQYPASRLDTGRVPLLGGLFRPPLVRRFAGSDLVGHVYLRGNMLVLVAVALAAMRIRDVVLTHREREYEPSADLRPVRLSTPLTASMFRNETPVGSARKSGNDLLIMVRPTLVRNTDF